MEIVFPMRWDHLLAMPAQMISMFLVTCFLGNWVSILAPAAMPAGSFKAAKPKGFTILLYLAFMLVFPVAMLPTMLPLGIDALLHEFGYWENVPIGLVLTLLELVGLWFLYRLALQWQGTVLQSREQAILQVVALKSE